MAQSREVVHGHPDAGVVVAADGVHELIDFVAEKAYLRRLAGISRQVLASSADRPRTELLSGVTAQVRMRSVHVHRQSRRLETKL